MFACTTLVLLAVGLTSVSAQGLAFPTTFATVVRQNPTDIGVSRTDNIGPSAAVPGVAVMVYVEGDITITKTTYTGPWTKRDVADSTALFNPGGVEVPATTTRETIVPHPTSKVVKPTACPMHNLLCRVGQQPMFNQANGRCECGAIPTASPTAVIAAPAKPDFLNCPNMPVCTSGTLIWDEVAEACSCA